MITTDTKSRILAAAIELFAFNGYEKTTMRAIAEKVSIRSSSIYHFFNSKESILEAIFLEFESNFTKYRIGANDLLAIAQSKPLPEVLILMFHPFGEGAEWQRMMRVVRVILSLQYENINAQELCEKVLIKDAIDYYQEVLKGLYAMGRIKEIDFDWTTFILCSFSNALLQENLRYNTSYIRSNKEYEDGTRYLCRNMAQVIEKTQ